MIYVYDKNKYYWRKTVTWANFLKIWKISFDSNRLTDLPTDRMTNRMTYWWSIPGFTKKHQNNSSSRRIKNVGPTSLGLFTKSLRHMEIFQGVSKQTILKASCRSPVGRRKGSWLEHPPTNTPTHPPPTQNCMIESESSLFQKTKVGGPYKYTPKQLWTLTQPKTSPLGPQKVTNDPKIRSKSKVWIQGSTENKSYSAVWVDPKNF